MEDVTNEERVIEKKVEAYRDLIIAGEFLNEALGTERPSNLNSFKLAEPVAPNCYFSAIQSVLSTARDVATFQCDDKWVALLVRMESFFGSAYSTERLFFITHYSDLWGAFKRRTPKEDSVFDKGLESVCKNHPFLKFAFERDKSPHVRFSDLFFDRNSQEENSDPKKNKFFNMLISRNPSEILVREFFRSANMSQAIVLLRSIHVLGKKQQEIIRNAARIELKPMLLSLFDMEIREDARVDPRVKEVLENPDYIPLLFDLFKGELCQERWRNDQNEFIFNELACELGFIRLAHQIVFRSHNNILIQWLLRPNVIECLGEYTNKCNFFKNALDKIVFKDKVVQFDASFFQEILECVLGGTAKQSLRDEPLYRFYFCSVLGRLLDKGELHNFGGLFRWLEENFEKWSVIFPFFEGSSSGTESLLLPAEPQRLTLEQGKALYENLDVISQRKCDERLKKASQISSVTEEIISTLSTCSLLPIFWLRRLPLTKDQWSRVFQKGLSLITQNELLRFLHDNMRDITALQGLVVEMITQTNVFVLMPADSRASLSRLSMAELPTLSDIEPESEVSQAKYWSMPDEIKEWLLANQAICKVVFKNILEERAVDLKKIENFLRVYPAFNLLIFSLLVSKELYCPALLPYFLTCNDQSILEQIKNTPDLVGYLLNTDPIPTQLIEDLFYRGTVEKIINSQTSSDLLIRLLLLKNGEIRKIIVSKPELVLLILQSVSIDEDFDPSVKETVSDAIGFFLGTSVDTVISKCIQENYLSLTSFVLEKLLDSSVYRECVLSFFKAHCGYDRTRFVPGAVAEFSAAQLKVLWSFSVSANEDCSYIQKMIVSTLYPKKRLDQITREKIVDINTTLKMLFDLLAVGMSRDQKFVGSMLVMIIAILNSNKYRDSLAKFTGDLSGIVLTAVQQRFFPVQPPHVLSDATGSDVEEDHGKGEADSSLLSQEKSAQENPLLLEQSEPPDDELNGDDHSTTSNDDTRPLAIFPKPPPSLYTPPLKSNVDLVPAVPRPRSHTQ